MAGRRRGPVPARREGPPQGHGPIRTCVGCRTRALAEELLRVVAEDGNLIPDPRRRHAGRGAWLHPAKACLDSAEKKRAFPRALRVAGPLGSDLVRDQIGHVARPTDDPVVPGPAGHRKQVDPS
ncbi:YlxR family protein [Kibdelosporangium banguiense]|uniref:YlxR family protein n=1 Tax=Kibdelosporangium banguiense TaxID=1365924 RepID=UPI001FD8FD9D|nr:YlxR family protein [Kibdelosporangium banguiense]